MEREKPCIIHSATCSLVAKCNHECHQSGKLSRFKNLNTKRSQKTVGEALHPSKKLCFPCQNKLNSYPKGQGFPSKPRPLFRLCNRQRELPQLQQQQDSSPVLGQGHLWFQGQESEVKNIFQKPKWCYLGCVPQCFHTGHP